MAQQSGYLPGIAPPVQDPELQQSLQWAQRELDNISRQFTNFDTVQYNVLHAPPEKPRDGMTVVADGVNWNPGEGPGVYVYQNGAWAKVGGGPSASFSAHKNGVVQNVPDSVLTGIVFSTTLYNVGSHFAGNVWRPPAGLVHLSFSFLGDAVTVAVSPYTIGAMLKNGGPFKYTIFPPAVTSLSSAVMSVDDRANGTDAYQAATIIPNAGGSTNIRGGPEWTWFMGHWIGP